MKSLKAIVDVLVTYNKDASISAAHDTIWFEGPEPQDMSPEHLKIMEDHNCFWDLSYQSWCFFT